MLFRCLFLAVLISGSSDPTHTLSGASTASKAPPPRAEYVGDHACSTCHVAEAKTYIQTAHHLTTTWPSAQTVKGDFTSEGSVLRTTNPYLHFKMTKGPNGYFQSAVEEPGPGKTISRTERIDIVAGEPRKGQSYLFWKGDQLFQLPITYWNETDSWVNSPSYPDGSPHFDKVIIPRCLECHASYFEWMPPPANRYRKTSLVLGIICEKCHGPGREHVALHQAIATIPVGASEHIVNPAKLDRDRQLDVCGLCHSGNGIPFAPALSFLPGDDLRDFIDIPSGGSSDAVDVHGNQVQLLRQSRCFQSTRTMTCTTCHDVHRTQRNAADFSSVCLSCHQAQQCGEYSKIGARISSNCVDCHMPLQESKVLFVRAKGKTLHPQVRNHTIGIYRENSNASLSSEKVRQP